MELYEKARKLKIHAGAIENRLPFRPDLPTVAKSGVPSFAIGVWFGRVATTSMRRLRSSTRLSTMSLPSSTIRPLLIRF